jgi:hypothetical protein
MPLGSGYQEEFASYGSVLKTVRYYPKPRRFFIFCYSIAFSTLSGVAGGLTMEPFFDQSSIFPNLFLKRAH